MSDSRKTNEQAQYGFSMLELMVVVAIVGIVTIAAVPTLRSVSANNKIAAHYNKFVGNLQYARSEAVSRNAFVTVCGTDEINDAEPTCDANADWHDGWAIFLDIDGDKTLDSGDGDFLFRVGEAIDQPETTLVKVSHAGTDDFSLQFNGNGRPSADGDGAYSFILCDYRGTEFAKGINVNLTGRINRASDRNDDGTIEDETGAEVLDCEP